MRHRLAERLGCTALLACWLAGALPFSIAQAAATPDSPASAAKLEDGPTAAALAAIEQMHLTDLADLRQISAKTPAFDATGLASNADRREMFTAIGQGDFARAVDEASLLMAGNLADIDAHLLAGLAYEKLGKPHLAARHRAIDGRLLRSIMADKTGRSPDSAFVALTIPEEHSVLMALRLRQQRQALVRQGNHSYDVIDAVGKNQGPATIYFEIDQMLVLEAK